MFNFKCFVAALWITASSSIDMSSIYTVNIGQAGLFFHCKTTLLFWPPSNLVRQCSRADLSCYSGLCQLTLTFWNTFPLLLWLHMKNKRLWLLTLDLRSRPQVGTRIFNCEATCCSWVEVTDRTCKSIHFYEFLICNKYIVAPLQIVAWPLVAVSQRYNSWAFS